MGLQEYHRETTGTEIANGLGSSETAAISHVPDVENTRNRPSAFLVMDERHHSTSVWGWLKVALQDQYLVPTEVREG